MSDTWLDSSAFIMAPVVLEPSPALLAANKRLLALRVQTQPRRLAAAMPAASAAETVAEGVGYDRPAASDLLPAAGGVDAAAGSATAGLASAAGRRRGLVNGAAVSCSKRVRGVTAVATPVYHRSHHNEAEAVTAPPNGPPWADEPPTVADSLDGVASTLPRLLPHHLGWGSEPLTRTLRQAQARQQAETVEALTGRFGQSAGGETAVAGYEAEGAGSTYIRKSDGLSLVEPNGRSIRSAADSGASTGLKPPPEVKLYPDIGLAMLRQEQTAAGRLWLLLRLLDEEGQGWLRVANVRQLLTKKNSDTYLCGWRQLRNLLRVGEGLYWSRDQERIWLRSAAKVAFGLGVERLSGRPVALPLEALINGIGRFRAELYAAFHSGRVKTNPDGEAQAAPIARETLTNLSGVGETTQRRYEEQLAREETAVAIQANYAIGNKANEKELEEKGWAQGQALFVLEDFRGRQGPKGRQYVAWQLPNSYTGSHQHRPQGRQRRINCQLRDLVMKGMPGNESEAAEAAATGAERQKLYYPTGKLAAKAFNRRKVDQCYWRQVPAAAGITRNGRYAIWQHLEQNQRGGADSHA